MTPIPFTTPARRRLAILPALAAAALLATACGSSSSSSTTASTNPATVSSAAPATGTAPASPGTIVDVAAANPDFSILVAAVTKAGLVDTLSGSGPFTVFAPTNEAFSAALTKLNLTQEQLLASPDLKSILTYHVLSGAVKAADVTGELMPATVQTETLDIKPAGGGVAVNDAMVVTADVMASNGVIHAIDHVLLPPTVAQALGVAG